MPHDMPPPYGEFLFLNIIPEDYIWWTTTATKLAADTIDTTKQIWQELIPAEYHHFGKVFSDKEAEDSQITAHGIML